MMFENIDSSTCDFRGSKICRSWRLHDTIAEPFFLVAMLSETGAFYVGNGWGGCWDGYETSDDGWIIPENSRRKTHQ